MSDGFGNDFHSWGTASNFWSRSKAKRVNLESFIKKINNCQILVKCSWLVWRGVSSRPRDSSETFRIQRQTRWALRPKTLGRDETLFVVSLTRRFNKTRKHFSGNIHSARTFPQCFLVCPTGNIVSSVSFCFQNANYAHATRRGILTKIRACNHCKRFASASKRALI